MSENAMIEQSGNGIDSSMETVTPQTLVTEDHVQAALLADKGATASLVSWKIVDFTKKGDNYACIVTSVEVQYMLDGQSSTVTYVVKLNPCRNYESMKAFTHDVFDKEAKFYLDFIPNANSILRETGTKMLNFPKCIYASLEKDKEIIFFEDLRRLGFKMSDRRKGLDKNHVTLVLQELARLHASSILVQAKTPDESLIEKYPFLKKDWSHFLKNTPTFKSVFEAQLNNSKELVSKVGGYDRVSSWIDSIILSLEDIITEQMMTGKFKVICHGDMWCNNFLFRYDEEDQPLDVMLLDLQLCNYSSPSTDLNYLLYSSTNGDMRKQNLEAFFAIYYNTFCTVLEADKHKVPFTQAELQQCFNEKRVFGAMFSMMLLPFMIMKSDDVIDLETGTDETIHQQLNEMNEKTINEWEYDSVLRPRFLSIFDEMMEAGLIP